MTKLMRVLYRNIRKTPIFFRLFMAFLIVIILPGVVLANVINHIIEDEFYNNNINYVYQNIDTAKIVTNDLLNEYKEYMNDFIDNNEVKELIKACVDSYYSSLEAPSTIHIYEENKTKLNDYLYNIDLLGKVVNVEIVTYFDEFVQESLSGEQKGYRISNLDNFRMSKIYTNTTILPHKAKWFNTVLDSDTFCRTSNEGIFLGNTLTLTQPIKIHGNVISAIAIMNIDVSALTGIFDVKKLFNQDMFLVDDNGIITNLSRNYSFDNIPDILWKKVKGANEEIIEIKTKKNTRVVVVESLDGVEWKIISIMDKDNFMGSAYKIQKSILMIGGITVLVILIISFFVTTSISIPLRKLENHMDNFGKDDLTSNYCDEGNDEIGILGKRFTEMASRINDLVEKEKAIEKKHSEEILRRREAEFNALQMQINPHFIYNTLDIIRWNTMRLEKGNGRLSKMISGFANLMRYNVKIGQGYVLIEEEISHIKKYIQLIEMLHDNEIMVKINTDSVNIGEIYINKLTFQPIIENAIVHGKLNKLEGAFINIDLEEEGGVLYIYISNNGECISDESLNNLNERFNNKSIEGRSVGLMNVNERIKLVFGEKYGLRVGVRDGLTVATIRLPMTFNM